ncbi:NTP/NDP exchange transporter [Pseudomonas borbori]
MTTSTDSLPSGFARLFNTRPGERPAVIAGFFMFFLLFTGYFMLRPVRETMGVAGGVDNLQWLFTGTFVATLVTLPLFGWLASKVARRRIVPWVYGVFTSHLISFAVALAFFPDDPWVARAFYIWLSVFNLLAVSLAWSVLADVFDADAAKRLFALIAAGASLGGLVGPLLGIALVRPLGHAGLLLLCAGLLLASAALAVWLHRWRDQQPDIETRQQATPARHNALGGNPFAGALATLRSPYLLGIAAFVMLLASINTFLYFEQARLVSETFSDPVRQTQVFGTIDAVVQGLAILTQLFITGHLARRLGTTVLLVSIPVVMVAGFIWLALAPVFAVFVVVMVIRRAGEYALVRPGREMLYTVVPAEQKYKAKNFIDTVVYRGGDAVSGWLKHALDLFSEKPALAMLVGALIAAVWGLCGFFLGRTERRLESVRRD